MGTLCPLDGDQSGVLATPGSSLRVLPPRLIPDWGSSRDVVQLFGSLPAARRCYQDLVPFPALHLSRHRLNFVMNLVGRWLHLSLQQGRVDGCHTAVEDHPDHPHSPETPCLEEWHRALLAVG